MFANQDCPVVKIDSNFTGLRYAWEICLKQLPGVVAAVGLITMTGVGVEDDTVTVDGTVFTLVGSSPGAGEVLIGGSAAATATNLAAAINALSSVNAVAVGAVITVTAAAVGAAGNAIELEEDTAATLSGPTLAGGADGPVWNVIEPNSYSDFGSTNKMVVRNPIRPNRQKRRGTVAGRDATAGFNHDLTFNSTTDLMQGFCFALAREKATTVPLNGPVREVGAVGAGYEFDNSDDLFPDDAGALIHASGFGLTANNGLKVSSGTSSTAVVAPGLSAEASPPEFAKVVKVGRRGASGELSIAMNGSLVRLTSSGLNMTTLGLILGEWIFIGGDGVNDRFVNNVGFARVSAIAAGYLEFDKVSWVEPVAESGAGKTIHMYFGTVIRSEPDPADIVRGSVQLERTLGQDADGTMSEYITGAVPNELTLTIAQEDKATVDMSFIACDAEYRTGAQGLKDGARPLLEAFDAINTSSDFYRIKLASVTDTDAAPIPLFAYCTDMSLTVNNNGSPNKAIGSIGAIDISNGDFEVGGELTAYFATIAAVQAVRNNADVTLDAIMVKDNKGLLYDIPLLGLGNGRLAVEKDQAVTLPLETSAAESKFGHTLLFQSFEYLPDVATP